MRLHLRWLLLVVPLAACAPQKVVLRGEEVTVPQADAILAAELSQVRAATAGLPPAERAARLEAVGARAPGVPAAAEALHEAARLWRSAGDPARSAAALGKLLVDHPLYPGATAAKYELALTDLALGRARDGLATIASLYPRLPEAQRPEAARRTRWRGSPISSTGSSSSWTWPS